MAHQQRQWQRHPQPEQQYGAPASVSAQSGPKRHRTLSQAREPRIATGLRAQDGERGPDEPEGEDDPAEHDEHECRGRHPRVPGAHIELRPRQAKTTQARTFQCAIECRDDLRINVRAAPRVVREHAQIISICDSLKYHGRQQQDNDTRGGDHIRPRPRRARREQEAHQRYGREQDGDRVQQDGQRQQQYVSSEPATPALHAAREERKRPEGE
jgi:hypothetical protein